MTEGPTPENIALSAAIIIFVKKNWVPILFGFVGFCGSIASIISFTASRRSKKKYDYLLKLADLNIEKDITEEDIEAKKNEATLLSEKVDNLQIQIKKSIPVEAKRAVLLDRFDAAVTMVIHAHQDLLKTKKDLNELGQQRNIPKEILRAVETEIEPKYIRREKISTRKTILTVLSALAAACSTLLPYPVGRYFGVALIILSLPVIISLVRLVVDPSFVSKWKYVLLTGTTGVLSAIVSTVFGIVAYFESSSWSSTYDTYFSISFMTGFTFVIMGTITFVQFQKKCRMKVGEDLESKENQ